jgi:hypothetical protein
LDEEICIDGKPAFYSFAGDEPRHAVRRITGRVRPGKIATSPRAVVLLQQAIAENKRMKELVLTSFTTIGSITRNILTEEEDAEECMLFQATG